MASASSFLPRIPRNNKSHRSGGVCAAIPTFI